jgi:hypothetical protein
MGWALAKLKLAPPASVIPLNESLQSATLKLQETATSVRQAVLQVAAQRKLGQPAQPTLWIPALSQLAGHLLDYIGWWTVASTDTTHFQLQESSNLLWAWATAGRSNDVVFGTVAQRMMEQQRSKLVLHQDLPHHQPVELRPQEWSNMIWSFATVQCYEQNEALLEFIAYTLLDEHSPEFMDSFKSQELANTVWAVATLLSSKKQTVGVLTEKEQAAALTILRHASRSVLHRLQHRLPFRTQELANTAWALATLGFGLSSVASPSSSSSGAGSSSSSQHQLNNYVVLHSDQVASDAALTQAVVDAIVRAARPLLPRFGSQEVRSR